MWRWIGRTLRPRLGWLTLLLLLGTVLCLPLSLVESRWLIGASTLIGLSLLAAWLGFGAGQTVLPGWLLALFGFVTGIEFSAVVVGRLLPSADAFSRELAHAGRWLAAGFRGRWSVDLPFLPLAGDVWVRLQALLERLGTWSQAGLAGTVSHDALVLLLFAAIVTWWLSYFAGWQLARGRNALLAATPLGSALLANVALTHGAGINYLRAFMGGALLLLVVHHYERQQEHWEGEGIDYSTDLRNGVRLIGLGLTGLLLVVALLVPYITWQQTVNTFWRYAYEPWTSVTRRLDRLFAGRNPLPPQRPGGSGRDGGEGHSVGSTPSRSDDLVFFVETSDPPPPMPDPHMMPPGMEYEPPKHYWRTATYDTYTGQGWENSIVERLARGSADPMAEDTFAHSVLTQTYSLRRPGFDLAPAANAPAWMVDGPYTAVVRGEDDVVGVSVERAGYTVASYLPAPTVTDLRAAGSDYPPDVAARYLALPALPQRVLDLALELTAAAPTPYDKVVAIEEHLRSYDYDLEVPPPPPGQDVADYLLFYTRRGHCDYYATAMVVMLRAAGVPARHAVGYAQGAYDWGRHAYRVAARDAHAWVEVYFPGCGWVEFEPTPYRTTFIRPLGGLTPIAPEVTPAAPEPSPVSQPANLALVLALAALALGAVFLIALTLIRSGRDFSSRRLAVQVYGAMVRWADRVRLGPDRSETPHEFARRLGQELEERGPWAEGAAEEAQVIGQTYVEARYAAEPLSARDAGQALTAWEKLRGRLRWLYLWRR